ncbi:MAG TPA: DUF6448 family protein [Candidatus Acidoferrales bacterium]|nr:DUF6448 family protein [Candidatus Acidoferrales bacterium]
MSARLMRLTLMATTSVGVGLLFAGAARAHCDTLNGPVVMAAKQALEQGDLTPVLKWIQKEYEPEVRAAFEETIRVRAQGKEAKELADRYFFETVVRLHRAGEGAPYTGLKPAGTAWGPAIEAGEKALASGDVEPAVRLLTEAAAAGIRERFAQVWQKKQHAEESVEAGREFVHAYVEFMHYLERLHATATGAGASHDTPSEAYGDSRHPHQEAFKE